MDFDKTLLKPDIVAVELCRIGICWLSHDGVKVWCRKPQPV